MGETEARPLRGRAVAIVMADQSGTVRLPLEGVQGGYTTGISPSSQKGTATTVLFWRCDMRKNLMDHQGTHDRMLRMTVSVFMDMYAVTA